MNPFVIQISGAQGSGKSTLVRALQGKLCARGIAVAEHSYAKLLYEMHSAVLKIISQYEKVPEKDGKLLQVLGTEWGRMTYGEDVWVNVVRKNIEQLETLWRTANTMAREKGISNQLSMIHLISDCRFPNEAKAFARGAVYRLECPEEIRRQRILETPGQCWREGNHTSEIALDGYTGFTDIFRTDQLNADQICSNILTQITCYL